MSKNQHRKYKSGIKPNDRKKHQHSKKGVKRTRRNDLVARLKIRDINNNPPMDKSKFRTFLKDFNCDDCIANEKNCDYCYDWWMSTHNSTKPKKIDHDHRMFYQSSGAKSAVPIPPKPRNLKKGPKRLNKK